MIFADVAIAGAGLIGLSLAESLHRAGARVVVFSDGPPLAQASTAAAGMLAVDDPHNPPELHPLSTLSRSLYPVWLDRLAACSGLRVSPQTHRTLQSVPPSSTLPAQSPGALTATLPGLKPGSERFALLDEWSLDPRELAPALAGTIARLADPAHEPNPIHLVSTGPVLTVTEDASSVLLQTADTRCEASQFVDCTGAWSLSTQLVPSIALRPRKGQMLTVATPPALTESPLVLRTEQLYLVPRLHGPRTGHTVIGATVEDAGFDRTLDPAALHSLHTAAAALVPQLSSAAVLDRWAGLRPASVDSLPLLGPLPAHRRSFIASGHYRNGILLAPATAAVLTALLLGQPATIDLAPFAPARFLA